MVVFQVVSHIFLRAGLYLNLRAAGGYDAIWLLVCNPPGLPYEQQPLRRVETVWSNFSESNVTPLLAQESVAKGACVVHLDRIPGLREAIQRQ